MRAGLARGTASELRRCRPLPPP